MIWERHRTGLLTPQPKFRDFELTSSLPKRYLCVQPSPPISRVSEKLGAEWKRDDEIPRSREQLSSPRHAHLSAKQQGDPQPSLRPCKQPGPSGGRREQPGVAQRP